LVGLRAAILGARDFLVGVVARHIDRPDALPKEEAPADGGDWPGLLGSIWGNRMMGEGTPITVR
jgi:hypothetical protein